MNDIIKHYCHVCRGPITESDILGEFAIEKEIKFPDHIPFKEWIHFYHDQSAQDVLNDKTYMEAIGFFVRKLGFMSQNENMTGDMAKGICKQVAEEFELEFDKLELGIRAFYSFSISEKRKDVDHGTVEKG